MCVTIQSEGAIALVEINNPPVNATSQAVRQGLMKAIAQVEYDAAIRTAILICAGRSFVAGADIREFDKPPVEPHLPDVALALEAATKPWIAAIHGAALGGGLELALSCHYRIATATAKLGLPEVTLGLLPGAGGTVRLPRLIGASQALKMMAGGKPVDAQVAHETGLIDAIVVTDLRAEAIEFAHAHLTDPLPVVLSKRPVPDHDPDALDQQITKIIAKARGQNSPKAVCDAVRTAVLSGATEALAAERKLFLRLKSDPQSKALRHIFFAERAVGKDLTKRAEPRPLDRIGVIGGGTMGAGIAAASLRAGLRVTLIERDEEALTSGTDHVRKTLAGSLQRGLITQSDHDAFIDALNGSTSYEGLSQSDLIVEAVFEDMEVKRAVFTELNKVAKPQAVLATNTSYLDVAQIAQAVEDSGRVIGLHFFSPAHIMKLLELVIPQGADLSAVATGAAFGKRLGKITVPAGVCDGFIGNRIMSAYRRECDYMIEDGALPVQIDEAMRNFGFPMGVFEMQDLAGLDIAWAMRKRRAGTRPASERYVEIADKLCEAGRLGRKTGRGWYLHDGKTAQIDPEVTTLIEAEAARKNITRRSFTQDEIMGQILLVMQREGRAILDEGIAASPDDIDVVMVNGYGFPRWRGGPMFMSKV